MIDKDKQYRTRDGREVRIYATDGRGLLPIHAAVKDGDGWASCLWNANGGTWIERETQLDLVEVRPRIQRKVWLNVIRYSNGVIAVEAFPDEGTAKLIGYGGGGLKQIVRALPIDIDCEEGHGL